MSLYELESLEFYSSTFNRTIDGSTIYANNYKYSNLRAWMNGLDGSSYNVDDYTNKGFLDIAFDEGEKNLIKTTTVDNSSSTTQTIIGNEYACENTQDKIFALSYSEVNSFVSNDSRIAEVSDYGRATDTIMSTDSSIMEMDIGGFVRLKVLTIEAHVASMGVVPSTAKRASITKVMVSVQLCI